MPVSANPGVQPSPLTRLPLVALAAALGLALAGALLAGSGTAYARPLADIIGVTNTNDSGPGSLRDALSAAADGDTITFTLPANSVILAGSDLTVTTAITINGATATNLSISGGSATRVFSATAPLHLIGLTVTLGVATGAGGGLYSSSAVTLTGVTFVSNTAFLRGGGLYTAATLWATASNFLSNTTTAPMSAQSARGGGAYAEVSATLVDGLFFHNRVLGMASGGGFGTTGSVFITGTQFISNTAGDAGGGLRATTNAELNSVLLRDNFATSLGGGLFVNPGTATLIDTDVIGNHGLGDGGGARINGAATVIGSAFVSNTSGSNGGGLYVGSGVTYSGTLFAANQANVDGGGLYAVGGVVVGQGGVLRGNSAGDDGGGLTAVSGALLTNTQIISNSAAGDGGGLRLEGGSGWLVNVLAVRNTAGGEGGGLSLETAGEVEVIHATVADVPGNSAAAVSVLTGTVTFTNTLLAGYAIGIDLLGGAAAEDYTLYSSTPITATGGLTLGVHSKLGSANFVNAAADNFHLGLGSAATNAGVDAGIAFDFEGEARPINGAFDIGADERNGPAEFYTYLPLVKR